MAQQSGFWDSTGTGDGSASGYTETQHYQYQEALYLRDKTTEGVLKNFLNGLAVSGTATPVSIATGAAVVAGFWYINDASTTLAVSTPAASTRIDRVILRVSWSAQTVRLVLLAGVEGGSAPALTQTLNTTWEISLAQVSITTGGVITVTDERTYAHFNSEVDTSSLKDDAVTDAKLRESAALSVIGRSANSTGNPADIAAGTDGYLLRRSGTTLAFGQIALGGIPDSLITSAKLATPIQMMVIPILMDNENQETNNAVYSGLGLLFNFDASKIPTTATVKLCATLEGVSGTHTAYVKLVDNSGGPTDIVEVNADAPTVVTKSADCRSSLTNSARNYTVEIKSSSAGQTARIKNIYLLVEW